MSTFGPEFRPEMVAMSRRLFRHVVTITPRFQAARTKVSSRGYFCDFYDNNKLERNLVFNEEVDRSTGTRFWFTIGDGDYA
jgi:hypothetical protein